MKCMRFVFVYIMVLFLIPSVGYPATIGGAETQGRNKISISFDQEFIFDRDMKFDKTTLPLPPGVKMTHVKIDKMYRSMVKLSYGVIDNIDIYVRLGAADFDAKRNWYDGAWEVAREDYKGKYAFAYGAGLKCTYPFGDGWLIGADIQYLRHTNNYSEPFVIIGDGYTGSGKATFQEWQVAPYIAKKIGNFLPYLGAKYSDLRIAARSAVPWLETPKNWRTRDEADSNFGAFAGIDYKLGEHWKLNIEGRFVDETAMSVGFGYKF